MIVIGLVLGGVLVGRDLVRTSLNRKIISEKNQYELAFVTFRNKYGALPGDMKNPGAIWPSESWSRNSGGNADGYIRWDWEGPEAWRQLALAKMISHQFIQDCQADPETTDISLTGSFPCKAIPGKTSPPSQAHPRGTWVISKADSSPRSGRRPSSLLVLGANPSKNGISSTLAKIAAISSQSANYIDSKLDDGFPFSGHIQAESLAAHKRCHDSSLNGSDPHIPYLLRAGAIPLSEFDPSVDYSHRNNCVLSFRISF